MKPTRSNIRRKDILTAANTITLLRIIGTIGLIFVKPTSPLFLVIYTLTGATDALDGWVARRTGTASTFGARLDSIADLIFCAVIMIKYIHVLWVIIPPAIWYAASVVLLIRIGAYLTGAIKYHRFASVHTYLNKLTGAALFLLPYMLMISSGVVYCLTICALALVASIEELAINIYCKEYIADRKTLFQSER